MRTLMQSSLSTRQTLYERLLDTEDNLVAGLSEELITKQIKDFFIPKDIKKIEVKSDGVYIDGSLTCKNKKIKSLIIPGVNIKYVSGSFRCSACKYLKTLEGAPKRVGRHLRCSGCPKLTDYAGIPENKIVK